jgi:hypothetical protein
MNKKDNGIQKRKNEEQDMPIQNRFHVTMGEMHFPWLD